MGQVVRLPGNGWRPRPDQMPLWAYLENGGKRADICAHRRWGKDDVSLHAMATMAHQTIGTYWHMLPEAAQARKAIWDAVNPKTGKRRIDEAFPKELRESTRNDDMFIRFKVGSTWQVVGSDNYNSLVGSPPIGVVFSEWSIALPNAWAYLRPILRENGGKAIFIWTPRGRNHATRAFEAREKDAYWFTQRIPAAIRIDGLPKDQMPKGPQAFKCLTPVFTAEDLWQELKEMVEEAGSDQEGLAQFGQEYLVDFDAPVPGSYYGTLITQAIQAGRVGNFPWDPAYPVSTSWDLGIDDYTAIWFWQRLQRQRIRAIGYYECSDLGFDDDQGGGIIREAFGPRIATGWKFDLHYLPHDVQVRELGAGGRSRRETLMRLGIRPIRVGVARDDDEKINASRRLIPHIDFDAEACAAGIDHLKNYRKRWNKLLNQFGGPLHNEDSHGADALAEFAVNAASRNFLKQIEPRNPPDLGMRRVASQILGKHIPRAIPWKVA